MYQKFFTLHEAATGGLQIEANIDALSAFAARHPGLATVMIVPSADTITDRPAAGGRPLCRGGALDGEDRAGAGGERALSRPDRHAAQHARRVSLLPHRPPLDHPRAPITPISTMPARWAKRPLPRRACPRPGGDDFFGTLYSKSKLYNAQADQLAYYPQLDGRDDHPAAGGPCRPAAVRGGLCGRAP